MYSYNIIPEKELVIMVFSGQVDLQEIIKANTEVIQDPRFKHSFDGVVDHRKSEAVLTREEIKILAQNVKDNDNTEGRWVIIVESPEKTALSEIYADNIKDQHPENICSTIKGASDYLGVDLTDHLEASSFD